MSRRIFACLVILAVLCFIQAQGILADEVFLKNTDRISGVITEGDGVLFVETEAMGTVPVKKEFIDRVVTDAELKEQPEIQVAEEEAPAVEWTKEISVGYDKTSGNTQKSSLSTALVLKRKTEDDEFDFKGDTYYSESNNKMDAQKWNLMTRYALSFWEKDWFNFYKVDVNHDRFANIDYRIVPSAGIGYWFFDNDDEKLMVELGAGVQYTNYNDGTSDETEPVLIPRAYGEKRIFKNARISEDITLYPSLQDAGDYRLHSETALTNPINDELSLKLSWINDYDSNPAAGIKDHDMSLITSLVYSF
ncbi:YdiY family protein [Candidatus Omnitrophota bacterium]